MWHPLVVSDNTTAQAIIFDALSPVTKVMGKPRVSLFREFKYQKALVSEYCGQLYYTDRPTDYFIKPFCRFRQGN